METLQEMIAKIDETMLESFTEQGWEDTPEHRTWFLEGLREAWTEDTEVDPDLAFAKSRWMLALDLDLVLQKVKMLPFNQIFSHVNHEHPLAPPEGGHL